MKGGSSAYNKKPALCAPRSSMRFSQKARRSEPPYVKVCYGSLFIFSRHIFPEGGVELLGSSLSPAVGLMFIILSGARRDAGRFVCGLWPNLVVVVVVGATP